jgi:hypothetical protein
MRFSGYRDVGGGSAHDFDAKYTRPQQGAVELDDDSPPF